MKEWAISFVACMLVVTLVENILPEGKYEKYIKYITAVVFLMSQTYSIQTPARFRRIHSAYTAD